MMHCSNRNSKKEKKTLRSLKFNPSVDSPQFVLENLIFSVKGTDSKTERYTAHTYTGLHTCGVGEHIHSVTQFICIEVYRLGRIHCAFFLLQLLSLGGGCSL